MMKRILLTAGGTASAYYFSKMIRQHLSDRVHLTIADVNDPHLIAASALADDYIKAPFISEENYKDTLLVEVEKRRIDIMIPLIDLDLKEFPKDDRRLAELGCVSTAPHLEVCEMFSDKVELSRTAAGLGIPTPTIIPRDRINEDDYYFVKPRIGFGSRGAEKLRGKTILADDSNSERVIQELCKGPEVTVEVFCNEGHVDTLCRERIEVKAGVCTKARVYRDDTLNDFIKLIADNYSLPAASCFQFMKTSGNEWCLTDANLRIGAGSALCAALGWNLPLAALRCWLGQGNQALGSLQFGNSERFVVRVFEEVVLG